MLHNICQDLLPDTLKLKYTVEGLEVYNLLKLTCIQSSMTLLCKVEFPFGSSIDVWCIINVEHNIMEIKEP